MLRRYFSSLGATSTDPIPPAHTTFTILRSNNLLVHCSSATQTVYTAVGDHILPGYTVYTDIYLTTPLLGYDLISDVLFGEIYLLDNATGVVGASTGSTC